MFLPLGDTPQPPRGYVAWVNWLLIAANVAVYLLLTLPLSLDAADPADPLVRSVVERISRHGLADGSLVLTGWDVFVEQYGYVPAHPSALTLFTGMFMHAGAAHLFGNLLFLWIYGDNVEHRLGRLPYLAMYLGSGVIATLAFSAFAGDGSTPLVGASGAISGSLGAYFLMFPRNQVRLFVFLFPFVMNVWLVPARLVLGAYVILDNLLPILLSAGGGVAHGAHLGGFFAGLGVAALAERFLAPEAEGSAVRGDPNAEAVRYLVAAERLAAQGQHAAALRWYQAALELTEDPEVATLARRGIRALRVDPRLADRFSD